MRDRNTIPLTSLVVLALIPVVLLGGVWGLAEANEPPATTTTTTTVPPPPVDELTTDILSFRRHPTPIAIDAAEAESLAAFEAAADELTATIGDGMCLTIRRGDEIVIDDAETATGAGREPRADELGQQHAAEPARADDEHACSGQSILRGCAEAGQRELARVAEGIGHSEIVAGPTGRSVT